MQMLPKPEIITVNPYGEKPSDLPTVETPRAWFDSIPADEFVEWLEIIQAAQPEEQAILRATPVPALVKAIRRIMHTGDKSAWHCLSIFSALPKGQYTFAQVRCALIYLSEKGTIEFNHYHYTQGGGKIKAYRLHKPPAQK